ncbi:hypothetical protein [Paraburkholderia atlantica]|uniref:hypothetical protein n=1 Tax=Paraburkholderia atlantica TaxID=2654982 RepID=UPI001613E02B|nr:hypothetical protein [Paraburkholderia atlantica]MBB5414090.1 hypothetical protein [Paraburkholderia atlantica]
MSEKAGARRARPLKPYLISRRASESPETHQARSKPRNTALSGGEARKEFHMNAQELINSIEADIERIRNLDPALLASLVARLDELRKLTK